MSKQTAPNSDDDFFQVLDLFYQRGVESVTPTYIAYVLRISPERANELLDDMVRNSMLELDTDEEGHLQYTLPDQEMRRIEETGFDREESAPQAPRESSGRYDGSLEGATSVDQSGDEYSESLRGSTARQKPHPQPPPKNHSTSANAKAKSALEPKSNDSEVVVLSSGNQGDGSPMLAAFLSLVIPGMGQVYNQEVGKGLLMFFAWFVGWVFLLFWVVSIWSSFDAYQVAQHRGLIEE